MRPPYPPSNAAEQKALESWLGGTVARLQAAMLRHPLLVLRATRWIRRNRLHNTAHIVRPLLARCWPPLQHALGPNTNRIRPLTEDDYRVAAQFIRDNPAACDLKGPRT